MSYSPDFEKAIESCDVSKIRKLIHSVDWINYSDGFLPSSHYLMTAAETTNAEIIRLLIEFGADINQKDDDGWTVLMFTALEGYLDIIKILIEFGADVNIKSPSGEYALYLAASRGHREIFEILKPLTSAQLRKEAEGQLLKTVQQQQKQKAVKPGVRGLINAAREGNSRKVQQAIEIGVDLNGFDEMECTPLQAAAVGGNLEIINALLKAGANPNFALVQSPLAIAAATKRLEVVQLLIEAGAEVNQMVKGMTVLHHAALFSNPEIVQELIKAGADINAKDIKGNNPLIYAQKASNKAIIEILKKAGAIED